MRLSRQPRPSSAEEDFAGAVRDACGRLGLTVVALQADRVDLLGRINGTVALEDVRSACALRPREQWTGAVVEALQGLALSLEQGIDLTDADAVRPLLRSRVYTEGGVLADDVVHRPLADGLVEVLVVEVGGAVRPLPPHVLAGWGTDADTELERARRQVRDREVLQRSSLDLGAPVVALASTSAFAATHVRWLASYVDVPAAGALVALPTRHLLLCAPVVGRAQTIDAAQALLVNAERLWEQGPGGLSPDLWWWREGGLVRLPGTPTSLSPPLEFVEVLDALPG